LDFIDLICRGQYTFLNLGQLAACHFAPLGTVYLFNHGQLAACHFALETSARLNEAPTGKLIWGGK